MATYCSVDSNMKSLLFLCGNESRIRIIDIEKKELLYYDNSEKTGKVNCLELMQIKNSKGLMRNYLLCGRDKTIKLYDVDVNKVSLTLLNTLSYHTGYVYSVKAVVLNNGKFVIASAGSDKIIIIWNFEKNTNNKIAAHNDCITCLEKMKLYTGEVVLLSASYDKLIKVWNPENGSKIKEISGHEGRIECVVKVTWPEKYVDIIASCADDKTIRIWDYATGMCLQKLVGHTGKVNCLTEVRYNGKMVLASSSEDKKIKLWNINQ